MSKAHVVATGVLWFGLTLGSAALSTVAAQPAPSGPADFSGVGRSRKVAVVDDAGRETRGRVLRVQPDVLTLSVDGRTVVFALRDVAAVHGIGDPLRNGMLIGLAVGGGFGILAGAVGTECGGFFEAVRECSPAEKFRLGAVGGAVFGLVGLGMGAAVDRVISRRTVLYVRGPRPGAMAIAVTPRFAPAGAAVRVTATW